MPGEGLKKITNRMPAATAFKQQRLKAWQPILTPKPVIITFLIIGIIFVPIGVALLTSSNSVIEVSKRYDNVCEGETSCTVTLEVPEKMTSPVYMYYGLDNFYQNHRRFVKSRNDLQLRGEVVDSYSSLEDCDPLRSEGDSKNKDKFYLPCGLIAASVFNDTFVLSKGTEVIPLRKDGIAWSSDVEKKYKNPPADAPGIRVIADFEDEDFIVWMRTAGLPNFKKLHRIIEQDLEAGKYDVVIQNNYPVKEFEGKKHIILSTTTWVGGKNPFLGIAYIVVGCICLLQGICFGIKQKISPRKLGDMSYLDWSK